MYFVFLTVHLSSKFFFHIDLSNALLISYFGHILRIFLSNLVCVSFAVLTGNLFQYWLM